MNKEDSELLVSMRRMMNLAEAFRKAGNPLVFETRQLEVIRDFAEAQDVWVERNKAFVDRVIGVICRDDIVKCPACGTRWTA